MRLAAKLRTWRRRQNGIAVSGRSFPS
jgi:hypothetical protein